MKKIFLIFTVLFTCALPVSGFGDFITSSNQEFDSLKNKQQNDFINFKSKIQQKFDDLQTRSQQEINNLRNESDDKIAEIKRKSAEAFEKLEKEYNDFIQGTPFENCIPGWSYLECKQVNNLSKSTWSCNLKPGITRSQMQSDVEAYCTQKSDAFEYDPLENFEEPENEENDTPIRVTGKVEKLSPKDEVTAYDEHDYEKTREKLLAEAYSKYCDDEGYTVKSSTRETDLPGAVYGTYNEQCNAPNSIITITCYKKKKNVTFSPADLAHYCSQEKINQFKLTETPDARPSTHIRDCKTKEKNAINATACKISAGGEYSDIVCKNGYEMAPDATKCEKSDTPDKKLIKISGIVIDKTSDNEQTIGGVRITYDEGKKDKDGKTKYALHQTGNNGRFAIKIVPNSIITFTHKMYEEITTTPYSVETEDVKIKMSPTAETVKDRNLQALCEKDGPNKGTWNKTKKECNCKDKTATFDEKRGCVPAEEFKFEGVVKDAKENPIPDVKVKYGNQSTTTDAEGKFTLNAPKDTEITFSYKGYKNYTYKLTANAENQTIIMDPTDKAANNAKKKELCEADGPNKGTWNETFKTCNCEGKAFFDEAKGCVESTQEYTNAEDALKTLYEQFNTQLENIKNQNTPL